MEVICVLAAEDGDSEDEQNFRTLNAANGDCDGDQARGDEGTEFGNEEADDVLAARAEGQIHNFTRDELSSLHAAIAVVDELKYRIESVEMTIAGQQAEDISVGVKEGQRSLYVSPFMSYS